MPHRAPLVRLIPLEDDPQGVLDALSIHGPSMVVSKSRGCLVMGACGSRRVNLLEVGRIIVAQHDFGNDRVEGLDLDTVSGFVDCPSEGPESDAFARKRTLGALSMRIDDDLALAVLRHVKADEELVDFLNAVFEARKKLRVAFSGRGAGSKSVPIPPAPGGGQGAAAEVGLAHVLSRGKRRPSD